VKDNYYNFRKYLVYSLLPFILVAAILSANAQDFSFGSEEAQMSEKLVEIRPVFSYSKAAPGKTYQAALIVDIAEGWHINSAEPLQDFLIPAKLDIDTTEELTPVNPIYPRPLMIELMGEQMSVYDGRVVIIFDVIIDAGAKEEVREIPLTFEYQPCNDRECRAPVTDTAFLDIEIGEEGHPINETFFAEISEMPSEELADETEPAPQSDLEEIITKYGFWGYFMILGISFITGLLLSFSPCTYPMIPITVSVFAGQDRTVGRGFVLSLFYVASMAVMYGIMGLIVSLVGGVFGAWLASPGVVIGIAVVFVIFALSMFGLFELQVPASLRNKLGSAQTGGGVPGSIVLGIIAALVVSPCVGPFVASILLYVATYGSPVFGFITLFIFAMGLGTLYIIIGTFSSAINKLPNAGMWMESVKKFFGFVLILMALYFLRTIIPASLIAIITGLILIIFAVFGGAFDRLTEESKFFARIKKLLGILAFIIGLYLLVGTMMQQGFILPGASKWIPAGTTGVQAEKEDLIDWRTDLKSGLALAESQSKPVLIDTWATWCVNCRVLDRKTFSKPNVAAEAERFVPLKIQLETANSPETIAFMKRFNMSHYSLPTVLLLNSDGQVAKIIQGVIGPEEMIEEMQKVQ